MRRDSRLPSSRKVIITDYEVEWIYSMQNTTEILTVLLLPADVKIPIDARRVT
jgi:hypothetical protein